MYQVTTFAGNAFPSVHETSRVRGRPVSARATTPSITRGNPLLVIMAGMACFFGVVALVIGWS
jgi:hypothetical protein